MADHQTSKFCEGEICQMCKDLEASHKVGEEILDDVEPKIPGTTTAMPRHNFTAYVCCKCFRSIFGQWSCKDLDGK